MPKVCKSVKIIFFQFSNWEEPTDFENQLVKFCFFNGRSRNKWSVNCIVPVFDVRITFILFLRVSKIRRFHSDSFSLELPLCEIYSRNSASMIDIILASSSKGSAIICFLYSHNLHLVPSPFSFILPTAFVITILTASLYLGCLSNFVVDLVENSIRNLNFYFCWDVNHVQQKIKYAT